MSEPVLVWTGRAGPQQLLLEGPEEAFNAAVAFRLANECRRRFNPHEGEFVLEVVAHELRGMIVPELESVGGACVEPLRQGVHQHFIINYSTQRQPPLVTFGAHGWDAGRGNQILIVHSDTTDLFRYVSKSCNLRRSKYG